MIKLILIIGFPALLISCHATADKKNEAYKEQMFVKVVPFQTDKGWGYNIFADDKLYIHQALIPGISGSYSFTSREDALQVGKLTVQKMAIRKAMPYISRSDLQQLHIHLPG